jgi:hypothetical protein
MNTLRDAAIDLDAEKIINLCLDTQVFLFVGDGYVMNYEKFAEVERTEFPLYIKHQLTWDTLYIKVLSSDVVAALAPFHQILTQQDGTVNQLEGEVTWIATRTVESLKLIYGHAVHRPDTTTSN